jgi:hypothetical protein
MADSRVGRSDSDTLGASECHWSRCSHHFLEFVGPTPYVSLDLLVYWGHLS